MASDTLQLLRNSLNRANMTSGSSLGKSDVHRDSHVLPDGQDYLHVALANMMPNSSIQQGQLTAAFLPDGSLTLLQPVVNQSLTPGPGMVFPSLPSLFPVPNIQNQSTSNNSSNDNLSSQSPFPSISNHQMDISAGGHKVRQVTDKLLTSTVLQIPNMMRHKPCVEEETVEPSNGDSLIIGEHDASRNVF